MHMFHKTAPFIVAAMLISNGALAQTPLPGPALAPGGAAGVHAAEGFHPSATTYGLIGIAILVGGLALTRIPFHNPGNGSGKSASTPAGPVSTN